MLMRFGMNRMTHMSDHYASDIGSKADKKNLGMEFDRQSDVQGPRIVSGRTL